MRIGLIGLGRIGAFHTNTLVGIPAIDSLVVTDPVPDRTAQVVDRHREQGVEGVDSVAALLSSGVEGVVIAAGTDAHAGLVLACVEAGLPALCEKPVAQTGAAGAELLRRLEGSAVPVPDALDVALVVDACYRSEQARGADTPLADHA